LIFAARAKRQMSISPERRSNPSSQVGAEQRENAGEGGRQCGRVVVIECGLQSWQQPFQDQGRKPGTKVKRAALAGDFSPARSEHGPLRSPGEAWRPNIRQMLAVHFFSSSYAIRDFSNARGELLCAFNQTTPRKCRPIYSR
jgi:hypothetical protein